LEIILKGAVVAYLKVLLQYMFGDCRKPQKNLIYDSHCPSQDSNWEPPKCKSEALLPEQLVQLMEWVLDYSVMLFQLQRLIQNQMRQETDFKMGLLHPVAWR
jgi:hypothetical protein